MDHRIEAAPLVAVFDEWAPRMPNPKRFPDATRHRWVKENGVRGVKPLILSSEVPTLRKSRRVGQPTPSRPTPLPRGYHLARNPNVPVSLAPAQGCTLSRFSL